MKRAGFISTGVLSLALLSILSGCSSKSDVPRPVAPPPDVAHPVTDLSQVAPGNALSPFGRKDQIVARRVASDDQAAETNADLGALAKIRHKGDDKHPCEERLLNKKAAQFDLMSEHLMDQVFGHMRHEQDTDQFSHVRLPTDLRWVVITATLDHQGTLKELVVEQHSGAAAMDKLMIAACKKGLFLRNAPEEAMDANGNYTIRIEARMENYASLDGEHWQFKTYIGLAIL